MVFKTKRTLKKERTKKRFKSLFLVLIFLLTSALFLEFLLLNFSFGRKTYLNPVSFSKNSQTQILENALDESLIKYKNVSYEKDYFKVTLSDGSVVILSSKKDIRSQVSSLQLILSRLTIEGKKLNSLDFRYNNPVVSY